MAKFILVYLGGDMPANPEEGKMHFAKYKSWLDSLGKALVSPANPLKDTHTVMSDGSAEPGTSTGMSGFTILEVDSIEEATRLAQACPFLEINGRLEVSELIEMHM